MNGNLNVPETAICLIIPIGILVVAAILGTRSRLRYMHRIREAKNRGAFADMNTPENSARLRLLAVIILVALFGMVISIAVFIVQMATKFSNHYGIIITALLFFGVIGTIASILLQREINRRL